VTITKKFRSLAWAAAVSSAALSCYLISHRVSAERLSLAEVERDIDRARHDILALNTEFQTRSRMSQIEQWNRRNFLLEAPGPRQFLEAEIELASLVESDEPEIEVLQASTQPDDTGEDVVVDENFEVPRDEDTIMPQIQQAAYLVPDGATDDERGDRIAFLDDQFRGAIASEADAEQAAEDSED